MEWFKEFGKDLLRRVCSRAFFGVVLATGTHIWRPETFTGANLVVVIVAFITYNAADNFIKGRN